MLWFSVTKMKRNLGKKLNFTVETVRALVDHELHGVQGGAIQGCTMGTTKCLSTASVDKCYGKMDVTC